MVSVDPWPRRVTATWVREATLTKPCTTAVTTANGALAARLAADIDQAPAYPDGRYNCPSDNGVGVVLIFGYDGTHRDELVAIQLQGCSSVAAPGRRLRLLTTPVRRDLRQMSPPQWLRYIPLR
jgi:hypothetical protein